MRLDHNTVWDNCLKIIKTNVNKQSFKTWFEPIRAVSLEGNLLTIEVPNKFFYEWLEEHFVGLLKTAIHQELGEKGRLQYQILKNGLHALGNSKSDGEQDLKGVFPESDIQNVFALPGVKKTHNSSNLNPNYSLDNFIEGDCNKLARSAGIAISKNPGGTAFNPLFIYGNVGLGKTHLAQAIGNEILKIAPSKKVLYVTSEKFTNQFIQAIKLNSVNDLMNYYHSQDVFIVDDIQFLNAKLRTQESFFYIFNQLHQSGKQIILTSDRAPKDLEGIEERLISRFKWGLNADLQAPDLETRIAILEYKMQKEGVKIPSNVIDFICYNVKNNIRELEGVLVSLIAQSSLNRRSIDLDLANEVVRNFISAVNNEITVEYIQRMVAEHFNITVDKLQSPTRKRSIVIARQLSMYLAKQSTDKSLKSIGELFGGKDHSTVIYSCKTVQDLMDTDTDFKETVQELAKKISLTIS